MWKTHQRLLGVRVGGVTEYKQLPKGTGRALGLFSLVRWCWIHDYIFQNPQNTTAQRVTFTLCKFKISKRISGETRMECRPSQMNLPVLQMYKVTLLKGMGEKVANLSNFGKQYFELML